MQYQDYYSNEEFIILLKNARIIISHAGMGTIGQAVQLSKPVIVVPRRMELGEHFDNHQLITTKYMEAEGKIISAYETSDLMQKIEQAASFIPNQEFCDNEIIVTVKKFIENIAEKKNNKGRWYL